MISGDGINLYIDYSNYSNSKLKLLLKLLNLSYDKNSKSLLGMFEKHNYFRKSLLISIISKYFYIYYHLN